MEYYNNNEIRKSTIVRVSILLSIALIIIRCVMFYLMEIETSAPTHNCSPAWESISFLFNNKYLSFILSTIIIIWMCILYSIVYKEYIIIKNYSSMFNVFGLLTLSLCPTFYQMTPQLIAFAFIYMSFIPILNSYKRDDAQYFSLQTGTFMAIASIFDICSLILIPIVWHFSTMMRGFKKKALIAHIFGYITVYSLFVFLLLFFGREEQLLNVFKQLFEFRVIDIYNINIMQVIIVTLALVFIITMLVIKNIQEKHNKIFVRLINRFSGNILIFSIIVQLVLFTTKVSLFSFIIAFASAYTLTYTLGIFLQQRNIRAILFIATISAILSSLFFIFFIIK